jgi:molecular chaperone DnaJ
MHTSRVGDQHIKVYVYVPTTVSDKQRELLEELSQIEGKPTSHESRTFFDKVKNFFD